MGTVRGLAALYVALLDDLGLTDVTVVGNSIGGWIAAEMALLGSARIAHVVLVDATGIDMPGHLHARLAKLDLATLVVWGDSDQIVDLDYGRAYAAAIPGAQFELLTSTGHMPQIENPQKLFAVLTSFTAAHPAWSHDYTVDTSVAPARSPSEPH